MWYGVAVRMVGKRGGGDGRVGQWGEKWGAARWVVHSTLNVARRDARAGLLAAVNGMA